MKMLFEWFKIGDRVKVIHGLDYANAEQFVVGEEANVVMIAELRGIQRSIAISSLDYHETGWCSWVHPSKITKFLVKQRCRFGVG